MTNEPLTILMADDDLEDLELFEDAIHDLRPDIRLYKLTNGKAVTDFLDNLPDGELPCLIILDYNMPELSGPEVLQRLCAEKRYRKIPTLILSTSNTPSYMEECKNIGASEYFVKPNNLQELRSVTEKMLSYCRRA